MAMDLKPYRQYAEYNVINGLFALNSTGSKGSLVQVVNFSGSKPVEWGQNLAAGVDGVYSYRPVVPSKVKLAEANAKGDVLGMLLYDVLEFNPTNAALLIYSNSERRHELQCVISGEAAPIVTQGFFEVKGFAGVPGPGSGIGVDAGGVMKVIGKDTTKADGRVGTFITPSGKDGGVLIHLNVLQ